MACVAMEPALGETSRKAFFMLGCARVGPGMTVCMKKNYNSLISQTLCA